MKNTPRLLVCIVKWQFSSEVWQVWTHAQLVNTHKMYHKQILYNTKNAKAQEMLETGKDNIPEYLSKNAHIQVINQFRSCKE